MEAGNFLYEIILEWPPINRLSRQPYVFKKYRFKEFKIFTTEVFYTLFWT